MFKKLKVKIERKRERREFEAFLRLVYLIEKAEREYVENYPFEEFL